MKNVSLNTLLYLFSFIFIEFICIATKLEIFSVALVLIVSVLINLFEKKNKIRIIFVLTILFAFNNFFIGIFSKICKNSSSDLSYITQIPTILLYITGLFIMFKKKIEKIDKLFLCMMFLILLSLLLFFNSSNIIGIINYFRNFTCFYFFFIIGLEFLNNKEKIQAFSKFIINLSVFLSIIGFVLNCSSQSILISLGIKEVYIAKGAPFTSNDIITGRFTTTIFNINVTRIGSIMYEPINFAYLLILPLILSYNNLLKKFNKKNILVFLILGISMVSCFAKGPLMIMLSIVIVYFIDKILNFLNFKRSNNRFYVITSLMLVFIIVFSLFYYKFFGSAANTHFWAIGRTFKNCLKSPIFGYGLGNGGNYGNQSNGWLETGGESGLMGMIYQLGFIYAFLMLIIFYRITKELYLNKYFIMVSFLPLVLFIMSIFQENTFSPQCIGIPMIFFGGLVFDKNKFNNRKEVFGVYDT